MKLHLRLKRLKRITIATFILFLALFAAAKTVLAGSTATFRDDTVEPPLCYPFSLNENILAEPISTPNDLIGPDCPFAVEIRATGEWVLTGGYFDTPPYAWVTDRYYEASIGSFSFTCNSPQYSLDVAALPSYVQLVREDVLGGGGEQAPGKHYFFHISPSAPSSGSFNLFFSFITNCEMKKSGSGTLTPVAPGSRCSDLGEISINPRQASLRLPVTLNGSCLPPTPTPTLRPTNTPTPTSTPRPTVPPRPTNTPRPTITRPPGDGDGGSPVTPTLPPGVTPTATPTLPPGVTPTATPTLPPGVTPSPTPTLPPGVPTNTPPPGAPTPTPEASCSCSSMVAEGADLSRVKRGDVLNFTTEAYTPTPDTAEVLNMEYTITYEETGGVVANSGLVTAVKDRQEYIGGVLVDIYKTEWSYTVKESDPEGLYRAEAKINCGWKISSFGAVGGSGFEAQGGFVAGASTKEEGFFTRLFRSVIRLFTRQEAEEGVSYEAPFPTTIRPTGTSLQLGTFMPVPTLPPSGCTWVNYQIPPER